MNGSRLNAENGRYSFVAGGVGEHQENGGQEKTEEDKEKECGDLSSLRGHKRAGVPDFISGNV